MGWNSINKTVGENCHKISTTVTSNAIDPKQSTRMLKPWGPTESGQQEKGIQWTQHSATIVYHQCVGDRRHANVVNKFRTGNHRQQDRDQRERLALKLIRDKDQQLVAKKRTDQQAQTN